MPVSRPTLRAMRHPGFVLKSAGRRSNRLALASTGSSRCSWEGPDRLLQEKVLAEVLSIELMYKNCFFFLPLSLLSFVLVCFLFVSSCLVVLVLSPVSLLSLPFLCFSCCCFFFPVCSRSNRYLSRCRKGGWCTLGFHGYARLCGGYDQSYAGDSPLGHHSQIWILFDSIYIPKRKCSSTSTCIVWFNFHSLTLLNSLSNWIPALPIRKSMAILPWQLFLAPFQFFDSS